MGNRRGDGPAWTQLPSSPFGRDRRWWGAVDSDLRWWTCAVFCWLAMVTTLDATLVNVALPVIGRRLGADTAALSWVVDAYILALAGLLVLGGASADRIGRKASLYLGLILFVAGSV